MSVRRSLNNRQHAIPANASWIEFNRTDGDSKSWPRNQEEVVDNEGCVNFMRPMALDESVAVLWRINVAKVVAQSLGRPEGKDYALKAWPAGYQLFDHNKGPAGNPRHDPYLYGSSNALRFRSANEFAPHATWLMTDPTLNRANCQCKYCARKPQREITKELGLPTKRPSDSPSPATHRQKRQAREVVSKTPHAALRRAPKPPKQRLTGPTQWLVPEKNSDIEDALGQRDVKAIRYFRRGELVWCSIRPAILVPGSHEDGIAFWPGLIDTTTTKPETHPLAGDSGTDSNVMISSTRIAPSASRPPSPGFPTPTPKITWTTRQHTSYKIKLLATSSSILLSEDEVLPYLAYAPSDHLLDILRNELPQAVRTPAVKELDEEEPKMFAFDPCAQDDELERFKQAVAPYTLAIHIASKMATFWTPTDEWECKFTLPNSPPPTFSTPASQSQEPQQPLHSIIATVMAQNAQAPDTTTSISQVTPDVNTRILGEALRPTPGAAQQVITQLRYQGLWWGGERIWTDELVRLKLARCQFAPQGSDVVKAPADSSESTLQYNADRGVELDKRLGGAGEKGLFMLLEGLFVVEVPQPEGHGTVKECRASGMLYELVDGDWQEAVSEVKTESEGKGKARADALPASEKLLIGDLSNALMSASMNGMPGSPIANTPLPVGGSASAPLGTRTSETNQDATLNSQLSHPASSNAYPLPDPPKGYKFRPILAPGHEVVLSLSLISGRYYPHLLQHPLLQPALQQAFILSQENEDGLYLLRHLCALEGLLAGVHQSMEPKYWRNGRHTMFKEATSEAKTEFKMRQEELKKEAEENVAASQGDIVMQEASGSGVVIDDSMIDPVLLGASASAVSVS